MTAVRRLNHAVLYVGDARASARFYGELLGLESVHTLGDGAAVFMRAPGSANDHDLGLFSVGAAGAPGREIGLYHLAWEVTTLEDLAAMRTALADAGSLVGESDHGVTKSLYAKDPDGIDFEVMWQVPLDLVDDRGTGPVTEPLDLVGTVDRYGADTVSRTV